MQLRKIVNKETGELLICIDEIDDLVDVDPIKYVKGCFILNRIVLHGVPLEEINRVIVASEKSKQIFADAEIAWEKLLREIRNVTIPKKLIELLESSKKSEQEKLLNGLEISPFILYAFIIEACTKHGFKFSQYRTQIFPIGTNVEKLPFVTEILDNGEIKVYGTTDLSNGQLKQAIKHRTVTVAKIIENGDSWHCFFSNYRSLSGGELWMGEHQPHYHYISNFFGLTKERVVNELKSKKYKLGSLPHIKLNEH